VVSAPSGEYGRKPQRGNELFCENPCIKLGGYWNHMIQLKSNISEKSVGTTLKNLLDKAKVSVKKNIDAR